MSLARGKLNPLNLVNVRKLTFIPEHFGKITVVRKVHIKLVDQWINYHLNSRYVIKRTYTVDQNNKLVEVFEIALEDPKELTMLTLGCKYIHEEKGI